MIALPRKSIGLSANPIECEFKSAANWERDNSVDELTMNGDAAPRVASTMSILLGLNEQGFVLDQQTITSGKRRC